MARIRVEHDGRTEQRRAAMKRLADARALLAHKDNHARGAMYLAGYAVECKLKAVAMEAFDCWTLKELALKWDVESTTVLTHRLENLAKRLPLYPRLRSSTVWRDFAGSVNTWTPAWRYSSVDAKREQAEQFVAAVKRVYDWLDSNR